MKIVEAMDYRFENPNQEVEVDTKIAEALVGRDREKSTLEFFEMWASESKEKEKVFAIISNYKNRVIERLNEDEHSKVM